MLDLNPNFSSKNKGDSSTPTDTTAVVETADKVRNWYIKNPDNPHVGEARRIEAMYLIDAVNAGDASVKARMEATVAALRKDLTVPASERAIVAGSYDFSAARRRSTQADGSGEYEAVARGLIAEFPSEPQGYLSLLTLAMQQEAPRDRSMVADVLASRAPTDVRIRAQRLLNRLGLIGKTIDDAFAAAPAGDLGKTWQKKKPGVIYFWASWSSPSIEQGESLGKSDPAKINVVGICLDREEAVGKKIASARKLGGELIYLPYGREHPLAVLTGAFEAPLIYLVDENGVIRDVRGENDLEAKLEKLIGNRS